MARVEIGDGKEFAKLEDQHLLVMQSAYPSLQQQKIRPFRQYMTVDGTPDASSDMGVDGSATPVEFCIPANNDFGYFITIDLESFMPPYGVKLDLGSSQKLAFTIRDNVGLAADTFNAIAYGFDRFE